MTSCTIWLSARDQGLLSLGHPHIITNVSTGYVPPQTMARSSELINLERHPGWMRTCHKARVPPHSVTSSDTWVSTGSGSDTADSAPVLALARAFARYWLCHRVRRGVCLQYLATQRISPPDCEPHNAVAPLGAGYMRMCDQIWMMWLMMWLNTVRDVNTVTIVLADATSCFHVRFF